MINNFKRLLLFSLALCLVSLDSSARYTSVITTDTGLILQTLYGEFEVKEPVIKALIQDPYFERLKGVRQYGIRYYVIKQEDYTRYDHSLGVFVLLRRFGAPLDEQIAGLLHDVSHTVFSHLADQIFDHPDITLGAYQDSIHSQFIAKTSLKSVLERFGYNLDQVHPKRKKFTRLEQDLPDLCADRIEYNLQGGIVEGILTEKEITQILNDLSFIDDHWVFTSSESAKKCAMVSLLLTQNVFPAASVSDIWACQAIKYALQKGLLTNADIHFSTDDKIWQFLLQSTDSAIQGLMEKILHAKKYFFISPHEVADTIIMNKFRGVDPLVQTAHKPQRLTMLDSEFKKEFTGAKERMAAGCPITFIK